MLMIWMSLDDRVSVTGRQQQHTTILSPAQHPVITTSHQPVSTGWDTL